MDSLSWDKPLSVVIVLFHRKHSKASAEHWVTDYYLWFCCRCSIMTLCKAAKAECLTLSMWKLGNKEEKKEEKKNQHQTYANKISYIRTKIIYCWYYNTKLKHSIEDRCIIDSNDLHSKLQTCFKLSNWSIAIDDMLLNYLSQSQWRKWYLLFKITAIQQPWNNGEEQGFKHRKVVEAIWIVHNLRCWRRLPMRQIIKPCNL